MTGSDRNPDKAPGSTSPVCFLDEQSEGAPDSQDWKAVARWRRSQRERLRAERLALSVEVRQVKAEVLARHLDGLLASHSGSPAGRVVSAIGPSRANSTCGLG